MIKMIFGIYTQRGVVFGIYKEYHSHLGCEFTGWKPVVLSENRSVLRKKRHS